MDRVGSPFPRFASRGVHNICLGPRATKPELRGEHIVIAIFDRNDLVVRELREECTKVETVDSDTGEILAPTHRFVDVSCDGTTTVLHEDAKAVIGDRAKWIKMLDSWSSRYGVSQQPIA